MTTENNEPKNRPDNERNRNITEMEMGMRIVMEKMQRELIDQRKEDEERQIMQHTWLKAKLDMCREQYETLFQTLTDENARLAADLENARKLGVEAAERNKKLAMENEALKAMRLFQEQQFYDCQRAFEQKLAAATCAESTPAKNEDKLKISKMLEEKDDEIRQLGEKLQKAQQKPAALAKNMVDYVVERLSDISTIPEQQVYMTEKNLVELLITQVFCKHLSEDDTTPLQLSILQIASARLKAEKNKAENEHSIVQHNTNCSQFYGQADNATINHNEKPEK